MKQSPGQVKMKLKINLCVDRSYNFLPRKKRKCAVRASLFSSAWVCKPERASLLGLTRVILFKKLALEVGFEREREREKNGKIGTKD
jgi:hypothetical protein